jgi:hypothetical protein
MVDARVLAAWLRETERPPLPPGDAVSWAVLTEGTLLDGSDWPGWSASPDVERVR